MFEKAGRIKEAGAGVALWANATKVLGGLGLYEEVAEFGAEIGGEVRNRRGEKLFALPAEDLRSKFGSANLALHRADLQKILYDALPDGTVRLNSELVGLKHEPEGVVARFSDGREERGDLLVGSDGLHSVVRGEVLGGAPAPLRGFHGLARHHRGRRRSSSGRGRAKRLGVRNGVRAFESRTGEGLLVRHGKRPGRRVWSFCGP